MVHTRRQILLFAALTWLGYGGPPSARAGETVRYTLTPRPADGELDVTMVWTTGGRGESIAVVVPQTGRLRDIPALMHDFAAKGAESVQRHENQWRILHARNATLTIRYTVRAGQLQLDWENPHLPVTNRGFFHALGSAFLLTPQTGGGMPTVYDCTLRWELPERWNAVCSWGAGKHIGAPLRPQDLRESIYFAGKFEPVHVAAAGAEITVAVPDRFRFSAREFATTATRIIAAQCDFLNEKQFPDFVITVVPTGDAAGSGQQRLMGSGLYQSFALWLAPHAQLTDAVENLFAHELFHSWNGRLLKAREPDKLCYWFIEGFTDYYALRILYESGYWSAATYAKWLNRQLREYALNPARRASNEEIADQYWRERDTVGEVAYQRGQLLGLRWHAKARALGRKTGIDVWLAALLAEARANPDYQYSNADLQRIGRRELGDWFSAEFDRYVTDADVIELPRDVLAPEFIGTLENAFAFDAGFEIDASIQQKRLRGVRAGGPAAKAGVRDGDELRGWRIHRDPEQEFVLQIRREGKTREIRFYPRGARTVVLQFEPAKR